jgi:tetratricopeptide (TPR) repeat protein
VFLLIIPLVIYFFTDHLKKSIISVSVLLGVITGLWLLIRVIVFKDLHRDIITATSPLNNTLYAAPDISSRYATAFYILLRYVGLLFFPHPLSCDYNYAQIKIHTINDSASLLAIIFYAGIGIYSIVSFKKKDLVAFGILFFLISIAPVSNIFFLGGSSMAERFLYIPSFGFCLIVAYFLIKLAKTESIKQRLNNPLKKFSANPVLFLLVVSITVLYSLKTFSRNKDWKDTLTIFSRDIGVSKNSATANELLGNALVLQCARSPIRENRRDTFNLAKKYLKRALEISPGFFDASSNLGYIYLVENKADSAYLYLKDGIKNGPNDIQLNYYFGSASLMLNKFDEAINALSHTVSLNPKYEDAYMKLASSYSGKGDLDKGLLNYSQVIKLNPQNALAYYYSGTILRLKGDTLKANEFFTKAASLGYSPK